MSSRAWRAGAAAVLALGAQTATARAAPELVWDAVPGCPDLAEVRAAFRRMSVHPSPANVRARAIVRSENARYTLDLSVFSKSGAAELRLVADECATLADVVALQLALAADASATTSSLKAARNESEPRIGVALFAGGAVGPVPGTSFAVRALVGVDLAPIRVEAGGKHLFGRTETYAGIPERIGADFESTVGFARLCSATPVGGFGVAACAGMETGVVRGHGFGPAESFESNQLWVGATLAPVVRYVFPSGFSLSADAEVALVLARPEFHARGLPTLFSPDRTAAAIWIGVGQLF